MMSMDDDSTCCLCIIAPVLLLLVFVLCCVSTNNVCSYYIKMTALYLTIMMNAIVCAIICTPIRFFGDTAKVIFNLFGVFSSWTGVQCDARHLEYFETDAPYVVVANHQSSVDLVVMSCVWPPNCTIMMKKSLRWVPFFNYTAYIANTIFVDRFNHKKAMHSLEECVNKIVTKKLSLFVFPEGTRNREGGLLPFKKGAFNVAVKAGIPIIPLVISSYKPFYEKEKHYFANSGYVIAEVMEPISTKGLTLDDVPKLTEEVREKMIVTFDRISAEAANEFAKRTAANEGSKKSD
uniref:1-acyl-sn-glycerol-3-phosphate acyltransferase n=2 Tax=Ascaris lumbricoides TaxID=6252 RepID=A0A0M3I126_ASCLU